MHARAGYMQVQFISLDATHLHLQFGIITIHLLYPVYWKQTTMSSFCKLCPFTVYPKINMPMFNLLQQNGRMVLGTSSTEFM